MPRMFFLLGKEPSVPVGYETEWAPKPVWALWGTEKFLSPVGNRTPTVHPAVRRCTVTL
jgi:hypothetical protein